MLLEPKNAFVETFFGRSELGVRLLSLRGVGDYLRRDERLAGDALNVTMTLREALSQFVAHRREVLPVVDEQGRPAGRCILPICCARRPGVKVLRDPLLWLSACLSRCCWRCPTARRCSARCFPSCRVRFISRRVLFL
jgi:hypothetical protein